jgi:hypothetical protein
MLGQRIFVFVTDSISDETPLKVYLGSTKSIRCETYGVRRQAKRDAALDTAGRPESTKAPSPPRSDGALQMVANPLQLNSQIIDAGAAPMMFYPCR